MKKKGKKLKMKIFNFFGNKDFISWETPILADF